MCVCLRVGENYTQISLFLPPPRERERVLQSALLSLFIETFSLSHRSRVCRSPTYRLRLSKMEQRRKQERDYIGFGLAEEQESRNIGWGGRRGSERISVLV